MSGVAFDLVCPEERLVSGEALSVVIPALEGQMTAGPGHEATITTLRPGFVTADMGGKQERFLVTRGFVEISGESISVIAEAAFREGEVSTEQLHAFRLEAEAELAKAEHDEERTAIERFIAELMELIENMA